MYNSYVDHYVKHREPGYFSQVQGQGHAARPPQQPVKHRLLIDNRDRFDAANTNPFDFVIYLDNAYRQNSSGVTRYDRVTSVELKALCFPKIANELYVVIDSMELNESIDATDNGANRSYAVAYFDNDALSTGAVKPIKGYDFYQKDKVFGLPIDIDRLHFTFRKYGGNVVTASDTAGNTSVSMLFEITTV